MRFHTRISKIDIKHSLKYRNAIIYAILAAAFYAFSAPISKVLLEKLPATLLAALLYIGAGVGMSVVKIVSKKPINTREKNKIIAKRFGKEELPYIIGMIILDIAAPIFMMVGLSKTTAANASLLNNFEIVATSVIALFVFKELISRQLLIAISLVTLSSAILSFEDISSFSFSIGSLFVVLACICWGFENNCTRRLSGKNIIDVVIIKGFGSGLGSLLIAAIVGEISVSSISYVIIALFVGFVSYGLSVFFYVSAQSELGAAKTSTYYAVAPFIGATCSIVIFREVPSALFLIASVVMAVGVFLSTTETYKKMNNNKFKINEKFNINKNN